jgi:DNA polymerase alpha subunit B
MSIEVQISRNAHVKEYVSADIIPKCGSLAAKYNTDLKSFVSLLDAFMVNQEISVMSLDQISKFEQYVHAETKKAAYNKSIAAAADANSNNNNTGEKRPFESSSNTDSTTPNKQSKGNNGSSIGTSPEMSSQLSQDSTGGEAYESRKGKGESAIKQPLNPNLGDRGAFEPSSMQPLGMRVRFNNNENDFDNCRERYRYMFTTSDQRADELQSQLVRMRKYLCEKAKLSLKDLAPVGMPSPDVVWVCGRICCEAAEGKINEHSVKLEGSRRESRFQVRLDLKDLTAYSLFPGQVVLVEGINSDGKKMVVKRIVEGFPLEHPKSTPERLLEFHHGEMFQGGKAMKVITAAGPFTTSDSLNYRPFEDLLARVIKNKPDVLILVGPFVDVTQPLLADGNITLDTYDNDSETVIGSHGASYETVFIEKIMRDGLLSMFNTEDDYGTIPTNIVLVPSLKDAHHECVYPQPPFGDRDPVETSFFNQPLGVLEVPFSEDTDIRKRVHLMPNPCVFRMNEVVFGVTSNDVLFSLSSDEVSKNTFTNRLDRLAAHLLQQHSFAPQYPAPPNTIAQLDLRYARHWQMKVSPDVLVIPSKLTYMAREVLGSLVINPGHLTKGSSGGTFAELNIHPMNEKMLRDKLLGEEKDEEIKHEVHARSFANIVKI